MEEKERWEKERTMTAIVLTSFGNTFAYSWDSARVARISSATQSCVSGCMASKASAYVSVMDVDSRPPTLKMNMLPWSSEAERRGCVSLAFKSGLCALSSVLIRFGFACVETGFARSRAMVSSMYVRNSCIARRSFAMCGGRSIVRRRVVSHGMTRSRTGDIEVLIIVTSAP
jgi:hypothetical protein